ncbi:peptide/nickel transport system ATP-binding protein [Clostridium tetanomorphum]|uniref:ATP-binding cassette domain-containing protein n=1 Tax=Clostridium tetanomorphum TaxID=1553 RepID=UPI000450DB29|nr:ABC transporter ATP-binding protein [Clostridium tetanomorphum]KAJ49801.1 oligopeptide/dipeptide ABC transporter ATPase [Clostridium tetanomorphum DSM 665]MBP1865102.1 peptide/nickel transport system ATP-binding protein [Clostridium tetanomorphum]NRS84759.1 peptide/nickel transport system ATP-binding protein [Clostridium tetanomorphum]SQB91738.1 dipeptide transport ATP-binding protein dppD [Clostridium tetanomorphum]
MELLSVKDYLLSFIQYDKWFTRKKVKVLNNINLTIHKGEIVAILGASGSGKSVLAHAILGILPNNHCSSGKIFYQGKELKSEKLRGKEISFVPQSVNYLDPIMKIGNQVKIGIKDYKGRDSKVHALFEKYGLKKENEILYPQQISGGMARRVLIAIAMSQKGKLIIADEPTVGLDRKNIKRILESIKDMVSDGSGVLMITHDISSALKIANRIAIFYDGKIIDIAKREDFCGKGERLKHPYTCELWNSMPGNDFIYQSSIKEGWI